MLLTSLDRASSGRGPGDLNKLVREIAKLVRHPAYRRNQIVSPMLLRHLPADAGYAWRGEAVLLERLTKAKLDNHAIDHLIGSVQSEITRLRGPAGG